MSSVDCEPVVGCSESLNGSSIEWESEDIVMLVVGEEEGGDKPPTALTRAGFSLSFDAQTIHLIKAGYSILDSFH